MEERERKDQEKAEYIRARQERLGHVPTQSEVVEAETVESEEKAGPKAGTKSGARKKTS